MCILYTVYVYTVYDLESFRMIYKYFYMGICGSLYHSFNVINVKSVVKVTCFPVKSTRKLTFMESLLQDFVLYLLLSPYALTHVSLG